MLTTMMMVMSIMVTMTTMAIYGYDVIGLVGGDSKRQVSFGMSMLVRSPVGIKHHCHQT